MSQEIITKIQVSNLPQEFLLWLERVKIIGYQYEVLIDHGYVTHINVYEADNGDWSDVQFGKIMGSGLLAIKQKVFKPVILNGNFLENYDAKK